MGRRPSRACSRSVRRWVASGAARPGWQAPGGRAAGELAEAAPLGPVARACRAACEIGIGGLAAVVVVEIVTRNLLGFSFQVSDELGGYIVVGLTFLPCQYARRGGPIIM